MLKKAISAGVVHSLPEDLRKTLASNQAALAAWEDITPLARNEWICWAVSVKQEKTRKDHIRRIVSELIDGMRRPCCWPGCMHRTDKPLSPSQRFVLGRRTKKQRRSSR
ncbi:YdeI/OmpD-associated family protein [Patescibacteria group bacterium]|nr:YdeI/OmpD-associated family protein [Patescibacteria group bacterium]MDE1946270.1 YdeI/OmpD-associated family protein [Patescibacteria group bacterium]MDE2010722.1 YdeI/OmpD-associated family protein [Patescibacteria group bacterium]MDE2232606.1 YdeI/OmpD-associated family protein [Patescibacteria group bacterium]